MNIGDASKATGLPVKTIRYYEDIGLIKPERSANGYRTFEGNTIHKLRFIGRSRSLGFSIENCRSLLSLYEDKERASAEVRTIAISRLAEVEAKTRELDGLREVLLHLIDNCAEDSRPECPIIDELSDDFKVIQRVRA